MPACDALQDTVRHLGAGGQPLRPGRRRLVEQQLFKMVVGGALEDRELIVMVLAETLNFVALDRHRALVFVDAMAIEDAHLDDRTRNAGRKLERSIAHIGGLFAEDGAQKLFFRRHRAFALRRDLPDENIARLHFRADIDDARFVEILERFFADIGNVARDLLGAELGIARHDLKLLDMDRGEDVIGHDALGDEDRVLEVVAVPRHERDEHVPPQRQLAQLGRGSVGDDVPGLDLIAHTHQRTLIDAGRLVRALELEEVVDVDTRLGRVGFIARAHDNARRIDLIDDARAARSDRRTGIARDNILHAGADQRRFGPDERDSLALHVRAHQRAVRIVVLEERDERRGDGHKLLRRHVDEIDPFGR